MKMEKLTVSLSAKVTTSGRALRRRVIDGSELEKETGTWVSGIRANQG